MNIVERAKELAYRAHAGQTDKAGRPYIEHVARVVAAVSDDQDAEAVAWLHDVLEDCKPEYCDEVWTYPDRIRTAADDIARMPSESLSHYYAGIRSNPLALRVKLADIADNSSEERLALLDEKTANRLRKKYAKAIRELTKETDDGR